MFVRLDGCRGSASCFAHSPVPVQLAGARGFSRRVKAVANIRKEDIMKRCLSHAAAAFAVAAAVACQPGPAGLSEQDKTAIRTFFVDAGRLASTGPKTDWAAFVRHYYTEDATVMVPNARPVKGRAAIQAILEAVTPMSDVTFDPIEVDGRGDLAFVRGDYAMTMNASGASAAGRKGKYVDILKKQADGSWKVIYDSFSSNLPPPGIRIPISVMAADASPEVRNLGDIVGTWLFDGTFTFDPKAAAGPVDLMFTCGWFSGGYHVLCHLGGSLSGARYEKVYPYFYDSGTKRYVCDSVITDGSRSVGRLAIQPGVWLHTSDMILGGKPARVKWTLADMSPAGGAWKWEMSVAGGPWTVAGEGKYVAVK
jgi:ketosteroid isomerase-like protein